MQKTALAKADEAEDGKHDNDRADDIDELVHDGFFRFLGYPFGQRNARRTERPKRLIEGQPVGLMAI